MFVSWLSCGIFAAETATSSAPEPRRVSVGFHLVSIPTINEPEETFTAICHLHLRWKDPALVSPEGKRTFLIGDRADERMEDIGRPGIAFVNETAPAEVKHVTVLISPDGTVEYDREFEVTLRSEFNLHTFPFDWQTLQIEIESFAFPASELLLVPAFDKMNSGRIRLPQWEVGRLSWKTEMIEHAVEHEKYHRLFIMLDITRKPGFYVWQVFVPLFILILIASTVFFLPSEDLADRISVITTSLLTAVALSYTVRTDIPKVSYLTTVDQLFVTTYAFLGAKIAGLLIVRQIAEQNAVRARKIDRTARWVFPGAYLLANAIFITISMTTN